MVQVINDERDVFAHIDADIVRSGEKLRCLVYQVGGQDAVDQTVLIVLVKLLQSVGKQTEGRTYEYLSRLGRSLISSLHLTCSRQRRSYHR